MSNQLLVVLLVVGAALLAVWLDVRLAERMPRATRRILLHAGTALLATSLLPFPMVALATQHSAARALVGLFALVLPVFVYSFLTWIWMVKLVQRLLHMR
jgi:hypothetical protein